MRLKNTHPNGAFELGFDVIEAGAEFDVPTDVAASLLTCVEYGTPLYAPVDSVEALTVEQLKAVADARQVDVSGTDGKAPTKADFVAAIQPATSSNASKEG